MIAILEFDLPSIQDRQQYVKVIFVLILLLAHSFGFNWLHIV